MLRYTQDRTLVIVLENMEPDAEGVTDPDLKMDPMTVANGLSAIAFNLSADANPISLAASDQGPGN
jgi:hypothetical protein